MQRPSVTGSRGRTFCMFQCERSRTDWTVLLVEPTSLATWLSCSSGWIFSSQAMASGRSWRLATGV